MAITMGFVLRVDSYPTAVAIPLPQGMRPVPPIIDAQKIVEPTLAIRANHNRNHLLQRSASVMPEHAAALTYSAKGVAYSGPLEGGRLLDTYA